MSKSSKSGLSHPAAQRLASAVAERLPPARIALYAHGPPAASLLHRQWL